MPVRRVGFTLAVERWGLLTYTQGRPAESNAVKRAWFPALPSGHCLSPLFLRHQLQFALLGEGGHQRAGWTKRKHNKGSGVMGGKWCFKRCTQMGGREEAGRTQKGRFRRELAEQAFFQHWLMAISRCISRNPISSSVRHDILYTQW